MSTPQENLLGSYLKDRRAKLDPAAFGMPTTRRRTPGLRREEVALRANVSATWYTWLEQGRGGAPSTEVLNRLSAALALTAVEREHLFLLAQNRPPEVTYQPSEPITPQLQRVLDSLEFSPALVKTAQWDIVGWNAAAAAVLTEYGVLPPEQRNVLKLLFATDRVRNKTRHWEQHARFAVAAFRADIARLGATDSVRGFVEELIALSPEFEAIWNDYDLQSYGEGVKQFAHPSVGEITLEYSSFAVEGRPELGLIIYTPAGPMDKARVATLVEARRLALLAASTDEPPTPHPMPARP
jgi:transcriptional regulator with XRE-family HTH domain